MMLELGVPILQLLFALAPLQASLKSGTYQRLLSPPLRSNRLFLEASEEPDEEELFGSDDEAR